MVDNFGEKKEPPDKKTTCPICLNKPTSVVSVDTKYNIPIGTHPYSCSRCRIRWNVNGDIQKL